MEGLDSSATTKELSRAWGCFGQEDPPGCLLNYPWLPSRAWSQAISGRQPAILSTPDEAAVGLVSIGVHPEGSETVRLRTPKDLPSSRLLGLEILQKKPPSNSYQDEAHLGALDSEASSNLPLVKAEKMQRGCITELIANLDK